MELLMFLPTFILFLVSLLFLTQPKKQSRCTKNQHPPGRTGWPIIGETLEFFSLGKRGLLEEYYKDRMNKHSQKIFTTSLFGKKVVVLCGPEGNKLLFSNENKLVTPWWPKTVRKIFPHASEAPNTNHHESTIQFRKLVVGLMRPDSLRKYVGVMDYVARKHLEQWEGKNIVDSVMTLLKQYNIALACRLFLSIDDPENIAKFEKRLTEIVAGVMSVPIDLIGTPLNDAVKACSSMRQEILEMIAYRKANRDSMPDDILTHMLVTTDENGKFLSEVLIAERIVALIAAGNDTASITITLIMKYLAELPQVYDNVLKELREVELEKVPGELLGWGDMQKMKYSWNVACEVMRLTPPVFGTFRVAITDFTFEGFYIPKGTKLHWSAYSTHMNSKHFPEADNFDPSRFEDRGPTPYTYVPFGGGPRMCPGQEYARLEILAFMYNVVRKYRWEKIIPDEKIIMDPLVRTSNGLPIRLHVN